MSKVQSYEKTKNKILLKLKFNVNIDVCILPPLPLQQDVKINAGEHLLFSVVGEIIFKTLVCPFKFLPPTRQHCLKKSSQRKDEKVGRNSASFQSRIKLEKTSNFSSAIYRFIMDTRITDNHSKDRRRTSPSSSSSFTDSIMKTLCSVLGLLLLTACCCYAIRE